MPLIAVVSEGVLSVERDGETRGAAVTQGFLEVTGEGAELFVDAAEWAEDIDVLRSETALKRAEERLRGQLSRTEYLRTKAAVARAMARLQAAKGKG
jgi:F-type H+-transporting ATPase subunit epsilon